MIKKSLVKTLIIGMMIASMMGCTKKENETVPGKGSSKVYEYVTNSSGEIETTTRVVTEKVTNTSGEVETTTKVVTEKITNASGKTETVTRVVTEEVTKQVVVTEPVTKATSKETEQSTKKQENTTKASESNKDTTKASTESGTKQQPTEASTTQTPTQKPTETQTEISTEVQTEAPTQAPTEPEVPTYEIWTYDKTITWSNVDGTWNGGYVKKTVTELPSKSVERRGLFDGKVQTVTIYYEDDYGLTLEEARQAVLDGFNAHREKNGWPPVVLTYGNKNYLGVFPNETKNLTENAQKWASFMAEHKYFYHSNSYGDIYDPSYKYLDNPICYTGVNEAIRMDTYEYPVFDYYNCWVTGGSLAIHNQRYMDDYCEQNGYEKLTEIGIGIAIDSDGSTYYCIQATNN